MAAINDELSSSLFPAPFEEQLLTNSQIAEGFPEVECPTLGMWGTTGRASVSYNSSGQGFGSWVCTAGGIKGEGKGERYEGCFAAGKAEGNGTFYLQNGSIEYQGGWKEGTRHGRGIWYSPTGDIRYDGEWIEGKRLHQSNASFQGASPHIQHSRPSSDASSAASEVGLKITDQVQVFEAEWDGEGVYLYQAFSNAIADYAIAHHRLGGANFKTDRMTWVKPSFGWMLYRSDYGGLDGRAHSRDQARVLKVKISHSDLAQLLSGCACGDDDTGGGGGGGKKARVQWDPGRDLFEPGSGAGGKKEPREMPRRRAIQIGLSHEFSRKYVASALSIEDVTGLAHAVGRAHRAKSKNKSLNAAKAIKEAITSLLPRLPIERPYMPRCPKEVLCRLAMVPGKQAEEEALKGLGKWHKNK
mmetsp:Transcript_4466/g.8582  ORF Transcript_4466/g.8582 Transcript_4466/m.8582 type:complete len:414 (+) Transcript_4466:71-1312(+)